jgi:hypothetical protein
MPLHYGKAPAWLFKRMANLAREISLVVISEYGSDELLCRLANPFWFQALGCVLGFDWHSSGLTTTVCGAIKEGLKPISEEIGLFVAGGKGKTSRKTPSEIEKVSEKFGTDSKKLVYASRMSAKVDSSAIQDGYQLYHHTFIFNKHNQWAVIQQGMNVNNRFARRYHWIGNQVSDFVCEPHSAICCDLTQPTLNMVAKESQSNRAISAELAREKPDKLVREAKNLIEKLPAHHQVEIKEINPERLKTIFLKTYERQPENFEALLGIPGVGAKTIRALSLISELVYGAAPSWRDPARYSFAHGGKDGYPYPVNRQVYDSSIQHLHRCLKQAKIGNLDKLKALKRLEKFLK